MFFVLHIFANCLITTAIHEPPPQAASSRVMAKGLLCESCRIHYTPLPFVTFVCLGPFFGANMKSMGLVFACFLEQAEQDQIGRGRA